MSILIPTLIPALAFALAATLPVTPAMAQPTVLHAGHLDLGLALEADDSPPHRVRLSREHADLKVISQPLDPTHQLAIVAGDSDHGILYPSNRFALVVAESARLTLPADYPFGKAGDPLWVLPQTQDPQLLYLGLSTEDEPAGVLPAGIFTGQIELRLLKVEGPGHFFLWQASQSGGLDVRMNSADGIDDTDRTGLVLGSHEHLNYGFTTSGVYQVVLQAFGQRLGVATNDFSLPTPVQFEVEPLPPEPISPFAQWQQRHWPGNHDAITIDPEADPDADGLPNLLEYALGLDPRVPSRGGLPEFAWIQHLGQSHGALRFRHAREATDITLIVEGTSTLPVSASAWRPLAGPVSRTPLDEVDLVTVADASPAPSQPQGYYRLRIQRNP